MELRSLIEPNLLAGSRMGDGADKCILELQPAISFPLVFDQHLVAVLFNDLLVSGLECLLPRQSKPVATAVKVAYILDLLASEFFDYVPVELTQDFAIIS